MNDHVRSLSLASLAPESPLVPVSVSIFSAMDGLVHVGKLNSIFLPDGTIFFLPNTCDVPLSYRSTSANFLQTRKNDPSNV